MDVKEMGVKSLAEAIQGLLGRFADEEGVQVRFHTKLPRLLFVLKTKDRLAIEVDYEINKTSPEYINEMIGGVIRGLDAKRKERHESPIILTSGALN